MPAAMSRTPPTIGGECPIIEESAPPTCSPQFKMVANSEKPHHTSKYPLTNAAVGAYGRPTNSRFSRTRPKSRIIGVADGSIIATIITVHMMNMKPKSAAPHCIMFGTAIEPDTGAAFQAT